MPKKLAELAAKVISLYGIKPESVRLVQGESIKTVWKIYAYSGEYCLKRLKHNLEKSLFSIEAQVYMSGKGAQVPKVIKAKSGEKFIEYKGQIFVLYNWVSGRQLHLNNKSDLRQAVKGLAKFHLDSTGYQAPQGIRVSTKLGRWPHQYASMRDRLIKWRDIAAEKPQKELFKVYLEQVDYFIYLADKAMKLLDSSDYRGWVRDVEQKKILCHQDYGEGNALLTERGIFVLDLDSVSYELPARDLRKIILKIMSGYKYWDEKMLREILRWYEETNPLTAEQRKVLYIDLLFPHEFHNIAKNPFHKQKEVKAGDLALASGLGRDKVELLERMLEE
ncbi:CotS family spore coat protein [Desulfolucanica intricata]|uniref:CotS family spore coat protein n=1 Tax=Desulfolucanica intricata TaxID=1285191 RepID=UPI000835A4ED|nr:CotS family spore coat protein [Desulfolucanica intricata]